MFPSLRAFLGALNKAGELSRVAQTVSPILEIAALADRESKAGCPKASDVARKFDPMHADRGGRALLFDKVEGCDFPLAINVFGSYRRMEMALGCEEGGFRTIAEQIEKLLHMQPPKSKWEALRKAKELKPLLNAAPKRIRRGAPCQQVVKRADKNQVNLLKLPLIKCWPLDGDPRAVGLDVSPDQAGTAKGQGRYITFAGMHTIHADDAERAKERIPPSHNIGMYRAQLVDETHLVMHWHMHHDGAAHWRSWKRKGAKGGAFGTGRHGKGMPIAICFGGESVLPYAATAPLPPGISELMMAGFLNQGGIPMVRAKTVPLWLPANSEIVIEGWVSTECGEPGFIPPPAFLEGGAQEVGEVIEEPARATDPPAPSREGRGSARDSFDLGPGAAFEGPFGDHTGYYSLPDRYPIVTVTAITHRKDAIFPATIVGLPPMEDYYMGKATERIFLPLLKTLIHDIDDYHLPMFGAFHNCAFVRIRKQYPLHARRVMHAVWGAGQMSWTKLIIVVDESVDVHDERVVLRAIFENVHFGRDLELVNGPLDILDHAAPRLGAGHKLGIDATRKVAGEEVNGIGIDSPRGTRSFSPHLAEKVKHPLVARIASPDWSAGRCVFAAVRKEKPGDGRFAIDAIHRALVDAPIECIIALDASVNVEKWEEALFHFCANADPGRDLIVLRDDSPADRRFGSRIAFDATRKFPDSIDERHGNKVRPYPPLMVMDQETTASIARFPAFSVEGR
jgi:4-hydroxy-3-polyprenylbenzoate decarboxylase